MEILFATLEYYLHICKVKTKVGGSYSAERG